MNSNKLRGTNFRVSFFFAYFETGSIESHKNKIDAVLRNFTKLSPYVEKRATFLPALPLFRDLHIYYSL